MAIKAESWIKKFVKELRDSASSEDGEIKTIITQKIIKTAIAVTERRLKDLNELIDDP